MLTHALIGDEGRTIELHWRDGARPLPCAVAARQCARSDKTRSPGNGQRLITILDIPRGHADRAKPRSPGNGDLACSSRRRARRSTFPPRGCTRHRYDRDADREPGWTRRRSSFGTQASMQRSVPRAGYSPISRRPRRRSAAGSPTVRRYGFAVMTRRADGVRRALQGRRALRLCARDELRPLVRGARRGQSEQPRLHQSRAAGAYRQSLSRSGADAADPRLPGKLGRGRRIDRRRRL